MNSGKSVSRQKQNTRPKSNKKKFIKDRFFLKTPTDIKLFLIIVLLNVFGIIMIYSASYYYAENALNYSPTYFFWKQIGYVFAGLIIMVFVSKVRPARLEGKWILILSLVLSLSLLGALLLPGLSVSSHGASRWIQLGPIRFQVAEPIKVLLILAIANALALYGRDLHSSDPRGAWRLFFVKNVELRKAIQLNKGFVSRLVFWGMVFLFSLLIVFLSSNVSTAIIIMGISFFSMMITSRDLRHYFPLLVGVAIVAVIVVLVVVNMPYSANENFRITRIRAWIIPTAENDPLDISLQSRQALYAIASGGFFGKGLGHSLIKFKMPEPHNDYILSIIFEELGILGILLLTLLFVYMLYRIFKIFQASKNRFSRYLVLGIFLHFALQIVLNYAVNLNLLPTTGVTLPFISAGGSAALFSLVELGLVLAVQRENEEARLYDNAKLNVEKRMNHGGQL